MEKELNKRSETQLSKQQIQSKMADLKKRFQQVKELLDKSGFGIEDGKVTASDEAWNELTEKKPELRKWRHTPFPKYDELYDIYMGTIATGTFARGPLDDYDDAELSCADESVEDCSELTSDRFNSSLESAESLSAEKPRGKRRRPTPPPPPKKKSSGEGMVIAMQQFASAFEESSKASHKIDHLSSAMVRIHLDSPYPASPK